MFIIIEILLDKNNNNNNNNNIYNNNNINDNKRPSQQPTLGALTFLRSFVAGRANFCSHLLASLVHFTVVKSQAILSIPASWGHRSYFRRNFISSASFKTTKISTSLDMFRHNNFACGLCISIVALTATM